MNIGPSLGTVVIVIFIPIFIVVPVWEISEVSWLA